MLTAVVVLPSDAPGIAAVQTLWREYWEAQGLPPERDHFAEELLALPGCYAPPGGRLILIQADGVPAGTVALRPIGDGTACEGKRMFVRPEFRQQGIAEKLVLAVLAEAAMAGYQAVYAEVLPGMNAALKLYTRLGFVPVEPYHAEPAPGATSLRYAFRKTMATTAGGGQSGAA